MLSSYQAIIIGAGPAGLFAAIQAAERFSRVLVLEKQPDPGRKLLLTGSGQCNFTNVRPIREFTQAYGEHGHFLLPALLHFTNQDAIGFFQSHGLPPLVVGQNGKVFPQSRKARDVLQVLTAICQERKVLIRCGQPVLSLSTPEPHRFQVRTPSETYASDNLLLATGGMSYPATGSTGDGYGLAQSLGHSLVTPRPGLTPFFIQNFQLTDLAGTSFQNLNVSLWRGPNKIKSLCGDLVITHHGISGPVVHNLARYAAPGDTAALGFVPMQASDECRWEWLAELEKNGKLKLRAWLKHYPLTQALSQKIIAAAGARPEDSLAQLSREKRLNLFRLLSAFPLVIKALGDFSVAMVTCGGVALEEVNAKTMESRLVPGLYFAGEVLDIDGDSGGYDLQAAWSTASLAAAAMNP